MFKLRFQGTPCEYLDGFGLAFFPILDSIAICFCVLYGEDAPSFDFCYIVYQAKKIFHNICGNEEEFLPAIPNPEDIIMDDVPPEGTENHSGFGDGEAELRGGEAGLGNRETSEHSNDSPRVNQKTVANENDGVSPPVDQLVMGNNDSQETLTKDNDGNSSQ